MRIMTGLLEKGHTGAPWPSDAQGRGPSTGAGGGSCGRAFEPGPKQGRVGRAAPIAPRVVDDLADLSVLRAPPAGWRRERAFGTDVPCMGRHGHPFRASPLVTMDRSLDGRSPGSRTSRRSSAFPPRPFGLRQWHGAGATRRPAETLKKRPGDDRHPLTVAGAATVSAPIGSSSPCSLLIPRARRRGETVATSLRGRSRRRQRSDRTRRRWARQARGPAGLRRLGATSPGTDRGAASRRPG